MAKHSVMIVREGQPRESTGRPLFYSGKQQESHLVAVVGGDGATRGRVFIFIHLGVGSQNFTYCISGS